MREHSNETRKSQNESKEKSVGILASLFGCRHSQLSRPFSSLNDTYRVCIKCGARRRFNPNTLQTFGRFYFSPVAANAIRAEKR
ncbi:MAG TPA: hypothetical protein VEQ34_03055 [Pyrinomonadaceae bacterium]|nr:hypothetical protein [Pyrinomonadaceae bacterium]